MQEIIDRVNELASKDESSLDESQVAFLKARSSYLTEEQKAKFSFFSEAEVPKAPKAKAPKAKAEPVSE